MRITSSSAYLISWVLIAGRAIGADVADSPSETTHQTEVGGTEKFTLPGGTLIQLNTDSQLLTTPDDSQRRMTLRRGEAFFNVGGNPIEVSVDQLLISAFRASFSVRAYDQDRIDVAVLDGSVLITCFDTESAQPSVHRPSQKIVSTGQLASLLSGRLSTETVGLAAVARKLAWREQKLEFLDETLGSIADEFNRYGRTRLAVEDPQIRSLHVGGLFTSTDPGAFATSVGSLLTLEVRSERTGSGRVIRLMRGPAVQAGAAAR
jgi:transmembrane sensor